MSNVENYIKVWLPGETPWAKVTAIHKDGTVDAMIDNHLLCTEQHGYRFGEVLCFEPWPEARRCPWRVKSAALAIRPVAEG